MSTGAAPAVPHRPSEQERTRLIDEIVCAVSAPGVPGSARRAGLDLVCWLARRMPWDRPPCDARRQPGGASDDATDIS
ncbi:MAG: hypothetical protein AAF928_08195 [Myxococcota bacterium]